MKDLNLYQLLVLIIFSGCSVLQQNNNDPAQSLASFELNLNAKKYVLPNGLKVIISENKKLPIFSFLTFYDVGGRFESRKDGTTGATHFLEHMMFKGAKKFGPGEFERIIESNGGRSNAYTTFDSTVYYESLSSRVLPEIIELEADRMGNLLIEEKSFESERKVVLEERKMRYENSSGGKIFLKMMQTVFKNTPYGGSVIGDEKDLLSLSRDQVKAFFRSFYTPNNATIVIVGDVDSKKTLKLIKKYYGHLKKMDSLADVKKKVDKANSYNGVALKGNKISLHGSAPNPIFMGAYKGEPLGTRKAFVLDVLSSMLSGGASSYLTQKYVLGKKPILSQIYLANYNLKNSGVLFFKGELLKGTSLSRMKRIFSKDKKRFCSNTALNQRELQKTKNKLLVEYYGELNTNYGVASFLGLRENFFNDYNYYKKELEIYESITLNEVVNVCKEYFLKDNYVLLNIWNKNKK
jgi:zinc protease